jgi:hypothetical protein
MPCRFRLARGVALMAVGLTAGCAPGLTPQQEITWDAFKACQKEGSATLSQLNVDGSSVISGREGDVHRVITCMNAYRWKASLEGRTPAVPASVKIKPAPVRANAFVVAEPPVWSTGDAWRFEAHSAAGRHSTYTWRVDREETVEGVAFYVIKSGTREAFYRKSDLAYSHEHLQGELERRNTPPQLLFVWPLAAGAKWEQTFRYERPSGQLNYDTSYAAGVEAEETITVPAGTFRTLKIVFRSVSAKTVFSERWYSPEVRMWVRIREPAREEGERMRELLKFTPAGQPAQAPASQSHVRAASVTDSSTSSSSR